MVNECGKFHLARGAENAADDIHIPIPAQPTLHNIARDYDVSMHDCAAF